MRPDSFARRYWTSLTDSRLPDSDRERDWRGQPFWRRYLASLLDIPQPAPSRVHADTRQTLGPHTPDVVISRPSVAAPASRRRIRTASWLVIAGFGAAVIAVVAIAGPVVRQRTFPTSPNPGVSPTRSITPLPITVPSAYVGFWQGDVTFSQGSVSFQRSLSINMWGGELLTDVGSWSIADPYGGPGTECTGTFRFTVLETDGAIALNEKVTSGECTATLDYMISSEADRTGSITGTNQVGFVSSDTDLTETGILTRQ